MKPKPTVVRHLSLASAVALGISSASAATYEWTAGATGTWGTSTNWTPATVPTTTSIAEFDKSSTPTVTYSGTVGVGTIWLTGSTGNVTLNNTNATAYFNLYGGQTVNGVSNVGIWLDSGLNKILTIGQGVTYNTDYIVENNQEFYVGSGDTLSLNTGSASGYFNLNGKNLTIDGAGTTYLSRLNNASGQTAGTIIMNGTGLVYNSGGFTGTITQVQMNAGSFELSVNWSSAKVTAAAGYDFTGNATMILGGAITDLSGKIKIEDGVTATIDTTNSTGIAAYASAFQVGTLKTGGFTKTGTNPLTLSGTNTYTGTTSVTGGTLIVSGVLSSATALSVSSGATFQTSHGNVFGNTGAAPSGAWTIAGTFNVSGSTSVTMPASVTLNGGTMTGTADAAAFGVFLDNAGTVVQATGSSIISQRIGLFSDITFNTPGSGDSLTVPGILGATNVSPSGMAGGVTKTGAGTVFLTSVGNIYSGLTTINGGTLNINSQWALGGANYGGLTFGATGGTLQYASTLLNSATDLTTNGSSLQNITLTGNATIDTNGHDVTYANTVGNGGSGSLTKAGGGTLTLSGANTYTGLTTVNNGTLNIGSGGSLHSGNALTLGASGTANFANVNQTLGAVSNSNTATNALNFSASSGTVTLDSLDGAGNTHFGSNGTVTGGISSGTVTSVGALTANISGGTVAVGGLLTGTISSGDVGAGSLIASSVTGGTNTITGAADITTLDGGTTTVGGVATIGTMSSGNANLNGTSVAITTYNGGTVNLGSSTVLSISGGSGAGSITGSGGSLTKGGTGTLTLSGANSFSGGITVADGTLSINTVVAGSTAQSLGEGTSVNLGVTGLSSGILLYTGTGGTLDKAINVLGNGLDGILNTGSGLLTLSGTVANNGTTVTLGGTGAITVSGTIAGSGAGASNLIVSGTGLVTLSTGNSYDGTTTVNAGSTLEIANDNALGGTGAGSTVVSGGVLELSGDITVAAEALSISGTGIANGGTLCNIGGTNTYGGVITLASDSRINSDAGNLWLTGGIGGEYNLTIGGASNTVVSSAISTGTLAKDGAGILILSGANTYMGNTTVSEGTLALSGSGSIASSPQIEVAAGATLDVSAVTGGNWTVGASQTLSGAGTVSGTFTVNASGTIHPDGTATLSTTGAATISGTYTCDINATASGKLAVGGELTLSGASLNLNALAAPAASSYTIATYGSLSGTFAGLAEGASVTVGTATYIIKYADGGNNITLSLPPASGFGTWIGGFAGLSDSTPGGNPSGDGISNLMKYVLNGDPRVSDPSILPSQTEDGSGNLVFTYTRLHESTGDTTQIFEYGSDLSNWTDVTIPASSGPSSSALPAGVSIPASMAPSASVTITPNGSTDTVVVTLPTNGAPVLFARLKVTQP